MPEREARLVQLNLPCKPIIHFEGREYEAWLDSAVTTNKAGFIFYKSRHASYSLPLKQI